MGLDKCLYTCSILDQKTGHVRIKFASLILRTILLLSCQPRVTVTSCFVYKVIRDLQSIDHLCINPIRRKGLIQK